MRSLDISVIVKDINVKDNSVIARDNTVVNNIVISKDIYVSNKIVDIKDMCQLVTGLSSRETRVSHLFLPHREDHALVELVPRSVLCPSHEACFASASCNAP